MILVTGGTGFLGSRLVEELKKEEDVLFLTRQDIPGAVKGDISDYSAVETAMKDADTVFHLAALLDQFAPYKEHHKTTVRGALNVMKAAEKTGAKVVYMSSNAVLNKNKTNYSIAKAEAEDIVKSYWGKVDAPIIRVSLIYDGTLLSKLKRASYLPFPWKRQKIHIAHRDAVVRALIGAMKYGNSRIYNVADKRPILLTQLVGELAKPRPVLWIPPQIIWLGIAAFYPIEVLANALKFKPPMTATYLKSVFEDRVLDISESIRRLKYEPEDTLEIVRKFKSGDTEI
jgi:nucleoside-diphosphate-sugar epimerase